jgi:hypothetical protein
MLPYVRTSIEATRAGQSDVMADKVASLRAGKVGRS